MKIWREFNSKFDMGKLTNLKYLDKSNSWRRLNSIQLDRLKIWSVHTRPIDVGRFWNLMHPCKLNFLRTINCSLDLNNFCNLEQPYMSNFSSIFNCPIVTASNSFNPKHANKSKHWRTFNLSIGSFGNSRNVEQYDKLSSFNESNWQMGMVSSCNLKHPNN